MKFGVVMFPGSNCDHDAWWATSRAGGSQMLWHKDTAIPAEVNCVVIPGGFSYGDYLRCGAVARFSPIMKDVVRFAERGGVVIGICNGFQILTEAGLLPGVLLRNDMLSFVCKDVWLTVENTSTPFTKNMKSGAVLRVPVAHGEGNYYADAETIARLEAEKRVVFRYAEPDGTISGRANPNGSINNIAGIVNERGNVLGMMPHPERYSDKTLGCDDGFGVFTSIADYVRHLKF